MKLIFFSVAALLALPALGATQSLGGKSVPGNVQSAFHQQYPQAKVIRWTNEKNGYRVKFEDHNVKYLGYLTGNGQWKETDRKYPLTRDLPQAVRDGFRNSGYQTFNIDGIHEVRTPGHHEYDIAVDNGNYYDSNDHDNFTRGYMLHFAADGKLIRVEELS